MLCAGSRGGILDSNKRTGAGMDIRQKFDQIDANNNDNSSFSNIGGHREGSGIVDRSKSIEDRKFRNPNRRVGGYGELELGSATSVVRPKTAKLDKTSAQGIKRASVGQRPRGIRPVR